MLKAMLDSDFPIYYINSAYDDAWSYIMLEDMATIFLQHL